MNKEIQIPDLSAYPALNEFMNKKDKFILNDNNEVIPATLLEWGQFLESSAARRRIARDEVNGFLISTVFIGLDHSFDNTLDIFETMIFKGDKSECYCDRYSNWKDAEEGHKKAIAWVKNGCIEDNE